jgi:hypothetical protein
VREVHLFVQTDAHLLWRNLHQREPAKALHYVRVVVGPVSYHYRIHIKRALARSLWRKLRQRDRHVKDDLHKYEHTTTYNFYDLHQKTVCHRAFLFLLNM